MPKRIECSWQYVECEHPANIGCQFCDQDPHAGRYERYGPTKECPFSWFDGKAIKCTGSVLLLLTILGLIGLEIKRTYDIFAPDEISHERPSNRNSTPRVNSAYLEGTFSPSFTNEKLTPDFGSALIFRPQVAQKGTFRGGRISSTKVADKKSSS